MLLFLVVALAATPPKAGDSAVPGRRPPDQEVGETLWRQSCSACHGATGKGDGPSAAAVVGGVASLAGKLPDDDAKIPGVVDLVMAGQGRMPAFSETIERGDLRLSVLYIRDVLAGRVVPKPKGPPAPAAAADTDDDAN